MYDRDTQRRKGQQREEQKPHREINVLQCVLKSKKVEKIYLRSGNIACRIRRSERKDDLLYF
jgi:hypothetical protein